MVNSVAFLLPPYPRQALSMIIYRSYLASRDPQWLLHNNHCLFISNPSLFQHKFEYVGWVGTGHPMVMGPGDWTRDEEGLLSEHVWTAPVVATFDNPLAGSNKHLWGLKELIFLKKTCPKVRTTSSLMARQHVIFCLNPF